MQEHILHVTDHEYWMTISLYCTFSQILQDVSNTPHYDVTSYGIKFPLSSLSSRQCNSNKNIFNNNRRIWLALQLHSTVAGLLPVLLLRWTYRQSQEHASKQHAIDSRLIRECNTYIHSTPRSQQPRKAYMHTDRHTPIRQVSTATCWYNNKLKKRPNPQRITIQAQWCSRFYMKVHSFTFKIQDI